MAADSQGSALGLEAAFGATRWSLVVALREPSGDQPSPLAELTSNYSYPVYAYLRRRGETPDSAARLLVAFFDSLGAELAQADPARFGRFRSFLLDRLRAFVETPRAALPPTSGNVDTAALERRLLDEHDGRGEAEAVFARSFALQVLARSRATLQEEVRRSERELMFSALETYLTRDPDPASVARLAAQLGIGSLAVQMAIKRLRQRFRQLVEAELQQTVSSPADLEAERSALHHALTRSS